MGVRLRLATAADLPALIPFVRAYHEFEGIHRSDAERRAAIEPLLGASPRGRVWLIADADACVGYVAVCFGYSIEFGGADAFVDELFIEEAQRGRGLGRGVLSLVIEEMRAAGVRAMHLEVARSNSSARALYAAAGFVPRERFMLMSRPIGGAAK